MNTKKFYKTFLKCNDFIIDCTHKSGSTVVIKQWFNYLGLFSQEDKDIWIHTLRAEFYENFGRVTQADLQNSNLVKIKYVRNPYNRAVSSFIHALSLIHI